MLSDSQVFETMVAALSERGINLPPEQIASDRATLAAHLGGETATAETTAQRATQAPATSGKAGDSTSTAGVVSPAPDSAEQSQPQDPMEQISQAAFAAPDSDAGYKFDRLPDGGEHNIEQEKFMRAAFHDAGIPQAIAGQIDRLWLQAIQNPPTAQQMEFERQKTHVQIERTYGADSAKVLAIAQKEFRAMAAKEPRLIEMAEKSGLGNSAYVISSLYNLARARGRA
jgi:hypothetical protein